MVCKTSPMQLAAATGWRPVAMPSRYRMAPYGHNQPLQDGALWPCPAGTGWRPVAMSIRYGMSPYGHTQPVRDGALWPCPAATGSPVGRGVGATFFFRIHRRLRRLCHPRVCRWVGIPCAEMHRHAHGHASGTCHTPLEQLSSRWFEHLCLAAPIPRHYVLSAIPTFLF